MIHAGLAVKFATVIFFNAPEADVSDTSTVSAVLAASDNAEAPVIISASRFEFLILFALLLFIHPY